MNKLSFIFDGKFYSKSDVKIPDDKSSESYVQGVINGIKTSSDKPLTAILLQQDSLYIYGYEIPEKPESVIENLWCTSPEGIEMINVTPAFIDMHEKGVKSGTEYEEIDILCVWGESLYQFLPINSEFSVRGLINFFIHDLNINFHPDDKFSDYLNDENFLTDSTGNEIYFDETGCNFMEDLIGASFEICGDKVYDFGFEIQQAKLKFLGIEIGGDVETEDIVGRYVFKISDGKKGQIIQDIIDGKYLVKWSNGGQSKLTREEFTLDKNDWSSDKNVDEDQLQAWLKRYNELPEGNEKEVAKSWVISLGGSVETELDRSGLGEENEPETIALANSIINQVSNTEDLKNIQYLNSEIERYRIKHSLDIMQMLDVNRAILNILDKVDNDKTLYDPKGDVVPKFVYDEDEYDNYREFNKKMITGFLGKQIDPSGSADWGGMPVWSIIGDMNKGIFVCIDDNDDVVLLRRDFDENIEENVDNELSSFDEDDTESIEYMLKCMVDKSEYNGYDYALFIGDDFIIPKDEFSNDSKELMMNADIDKSDILAATNEELNDILMNFYFAWINLKDSWNENNGLVTLDNLYPFEISFDDLQIKDWVISLTGNDDNDFEMFSSRYNSVSIVDDFNNFNTAFNEIIEWIDTNDDETDYDTFHNSVYPFDNISLEDLQVKINEWTETSIKSLENNPLTNPEVISEPVLTTNDKLKELIKIFVKQNSWFEDESEDEKPFELSFSTREYGNVGNEIPGQKDINKAKEIGRQLMNKFPGEVKCEWSTADEWVYIEVFIKGSKQTTWD